MNCDPKFVTFYVVVAKAIVLLLVKAKPRHGRRCIVYTVFMSKVSVISIWLFCAKALIQLGEFYTC